MTRPRALQALLLCLPLVATSGLAQAPPAKEAPRWTACRLHVTNKTPYRVLIQVDGVYWGWVNARQAFTFKGIPQGTIAVYGATQFAEFFWGPRSMKCEGTTPWELSL